MSSCAWCGDGVAGDDGFRAHEPAGERWAAFCRLEHVVPWAIQGPHWEAADREEAPPQPDSSRCARCDEPLGEIRFLLVSHRGEHRIADGFCSLEHLRQWAAAGGRWQ
jgi:hypothetical protein